jgi:hypothetical protein
MALVIDGEGKIYELDEAVLKKNLMKNWWERRKEGFKFLDKVVALMNEYRTAKEAYEKAEDVDVLGQGCCKRFPNWCPPGGASE